MPDIRTVGIISKPGVAAAEMLVPELLEWLARHGIEFDEIHFGKPHAHVYIDDNAFAFRSWDDIADDGSSLPVNREELLTARIAEPHGELR